MATVKEQLQHLVDELPDDCTFDEVEYRLYALRKIQAGLESLDRGEGIPHEQVVQQLRGRWQAK